MRNRFIYTGQDLVDFVNDTVINIGKCFKAQTRVNTMMYLSMLGILAINYIQDRQIAKMRKEIEEIKRPEGD